ncbi:MAG: hypothetical protein JWP96_616 [Polaromonas sp.]|nr:hypothetical protein [Polaromonas sp.]
MKGRAWDIALALGIAATGAAQAQSAALPDAGASPVYQDRVIEGLKPAIEDADVAAQANYDSSGWARQMRVETRIGQDSFSGAQQRATAGMSLYGLLETPNYGVLSIDSQAGWRPGGGSLTVRQRGLPVDGGWSVNNAAGVIGYLAPELARVPSRVYVPGYLLEGVETEWLQRSQGLQLQTSTGQPGRIDGSLIGRFQRLAGTVSSAAAQISQGPWALALRLSQAHGVEDLSEAAPLQGRADARSAQLSLRRELNGNSLQANLVSTSTSTLAPTRLGLWVDGEARNGADTYSGGLFRLDPGLSWAGQPMASDAAGGYLRGAWQTRQWSADASLDLLQSISNPASTGTFVNTSARWRYSHSLSFAASAAARNFNGSAWSTYGEVRWQNSLGSSGARLEFRRETALQERIQKISFDQDWLAPTGWSLATSLTTGRETTRAGQQNLLAGAASVNAPLSSSSTLRGNLTTEQVGSGNSRLGVNAGLSHRLTPHWSVEASYYLNLGRTALTRSIDPLATPLPFDTVTTRGHSVFIALRWEESAGSRSAPLGGNPLQGGGGVEGTVFLDANNNGHREASESGAAGITVYLDNRYSVRTDAQGHFEFAFVGAGTRVLTVLSETLPLPWIALQGGATKVDVRVRDTVRVDIGVVRQGSE